MSHRHIHNSSTGIIEDTSLMLAESRAFIEGEAICTVLAGHHSCVPLFKGRGITAESFSQPDFRLMWIAADHARNRDQVFMLHCCHLILKSENLWEEKQPAGNWRMIKHSYQTLSRMALRFRFNRKDARARADFLIEAASHETTFAALVVKAEQYATTLTSWARNEKQKERTLKAAG